MYTRAPVTTGGYTGTVNAGVVSDEPSTGLSAYTPNQIQSVCRGQASKASTTSGAAAGETGVAA